METKSQELAQRLEGALKALTRLEQSIRETSDFSQTSEIIVMLKELILEQSGKGVENTHYPVSAVR